MEYGLSTPERHDVSEVLMEHTPDNTLDLMQQLLEKDEEPPLKKSRGQGRSWIETNRQELVSNLWNGDYCCLVIYQMHIASDSKLNKSRSNVVRHQEKLYGWKCKYSAICSKETRLKHFHPLHPFSNGNRHIFIVEETEGGHTCDPDGYIPGKGGEFTKQMKDGITHCLQNDMQRPAQIVAYFKKNGWNLPTKKQISNFKSRLQDPKPNSPTTTGQLSEWCSQHTNIGIEDQDKAYVVDSYIDHNAKTFRLAISTKRLLGHLESKQATGEPIMLHADATYKIDLEQYPGTLYGTSDKHRHFHLHLFGLSWSETDDDYDFFFKILKGAMNFDNAADCPPPYYLMMDDAPAIYNGAKRQFPNIIRCMCFAHVYKNMKDKHLGFMRGADKMEQKGEFLKDLVHVACSWNKECFHKALSLMCHKYSNPDIYADHMQEAVAHLRDYWGHDSRNGWYSGYMLTFVRNNNGLESWWKYFKEDCTLYKRCNIIDLLRRVIVWVETVSSSYANTVPESDRRSLQTDPTTNQTRGEWEAAYNFVMDVRDNKGYKFFSMAPPPAAKTYIFLPIFTSEAPQEYTLMQTGTDAERKQKAMQIYTQWKAVEAIDTFLEYTTFLHHTPVVKYMESNKCYYCTCYTYCKNLYCYHVICAMRHICALQWPTYVRPGILECRRGGKHRGRGRPLKDPARSSKYTRDGDHDYFPIIPGTCGDT
jgi:hypothetical protein